jgi:hypothetical protein
MILVDKELVVPSKIAKEFYMGGGEWCPDR